MTSAVRRHVIALSSVAGIFFVFYQALVVQTLNSAIHRINHYSADRYELIALSTGYRFILVGWNAKK